MYLGSASCASNTPRRDTKNKEVLPGRLFSSGQGADSSGITSDQVNVRKGSSDFCYLRLSLKLIKQLSLRAESCAVNTSNQLSIRMGKMALIKLGLLLGMPFLIPLQPVKILSSFSSMYLRCHFPSEMLSECKVTELMTLPVSLTSVNQNMKQKAESVLLIHS